MYYRAWDQDYVTRHLFDSFQWYWDGIETVLSGIDGWLVAYKKRGVSWSPNKLISGIYYSYKQSTAIIADNLGSTSSSLWQHKSVTVGIHKLLSILSGCL